MSTKLETIILTIEATAAGKRREANKLRASGKLAAGVVADAIDLNVNDLVLIAKDLRGLQSELTELLLAAKEQLKHVR